MKTHAISVNTQAVNLQPTTTNQNENRVKKGSPIYLFALAIAVLFAALSQTTQAATPFNPVASAAQVMMQTQGDDAAFIAARFGVDPKSPLHYATSIDASGQSFAFALAPGSTYRGQAITLTATGTFDPAIQTWLVSSSGSIAGTPWTITKSMSLSPLGDALQMGLNSSAQFDSEGIQHQIADVDEIDCNGTWYYNDNTWVLSYTKTLGPCTAYYRGVVVTSYDLISLTNNNPKNNNSTWTWATNSFDLDFSVVSSGSYPAGGGKGSFSTLVAPAKAPCVSCSASNGSRNN
jgi:hypothetical protein